MIRVNAGWYGLSIEEGDALAKLLNEVVEELIRGDNKYGPHPGPKRGLGAIKAEVQELTTEVEAENEIPGAKRKEAVQVTAMGLKFCRDCT